MRAPSLIYALALGLIVLTLSLKDVAARAARTADPGRAAVALLAAARADGYRASLGTEGESIPRVDAWDGTCHRRLFVIDALGNQEAKIATVRKASDVLRFHHAGRASADFPRGEPMLRYYAQAYLGRLGLDWPVPAVIAELSSRACDGATPLPFDRIQVATSKTR